ncbi:cytochrome P450 [Hysterangium stoloniferum]|nr:cytochrome P450 [Hysterangium stoloniferum]
MSLSPPVPLHFAKMGLTISVILSVAGIWFARKIVQRFRRRCLLPPGPVGKPFIGNAMDMPKDHAWERISEWAQTYGDVIHLEALGTHTIYVNSSAVAWDLFEKRSSLYSDRFEFPMMILMGWFFAPAFMPYGQWWRRHRKAFHQYFHPAAAACYHNIQLKQTKALLTRLTENPEKFSDIIQHFSGATIMEVVYGIQVQPEGDRYIEIAEKAALGVAESMNAGTFLVDIVPWRGRTVKYVPEWFPGAGFQKKARIWREPTVEMCMKPFQVVKEAFSMGVASSCILVSMLEELAAKSDPPAREEEVIRNTSGVTYAAGASTTHATLLTFILAMVMFPEKQKKAQQELDEIGNRLPTFEDRECLPYVSALVKEIFRWRPAFPLAIPHKVTQDDMYRGYLIPKGSLVVGNAWEMLHDENVYGPRTDEFEPERFLAPGVRSPTEQFGFGRRICPGRYMADNTVFIVVASILKVFEISKPIDKHGREIDIAGTYTTGSQIQPEPFQTSIIPRSSSFKLVAMLQE